MENNIKELEIKNFKSIKHIKFNPKRVNVFIGKPNVGKSNILEGMSLLTDIFHLSLSNRSNFTHLLRLEDFYNLFYDEVTDTPVEIRTENAVAKFYAHESGFSYFSMDAYWEYLFLQEYKKQEFNITDFKRFLNDVSNYFPHGWNEQNKIPENKEISSIRPVAIDFNRSLSSLNSKDFSGIQFKNTIRRYSYKHFDSYNDSFRGFLNPPFGENLFTILNYNKELLNEVGGFIEEQGLEFVLDKKENKFIIQKKIDRIVYQVPYSNIADTLRHVIFYLAAIETNKDSVLIFEEPEVHSYPPYIKMLADRIVLNDENQYFISTHSPYMLNTLIDSLGDDELNVVLTYYEDYQTKIKILSAEELAEVQEWKTDIFFNIDRFINHLQEK